MAATTYEAEIEAWRERMSENLRSETGWLTLIGLYWLREGTNTIGSDPSSDILFPENTPPHFGVIEFRDNITTLHVMADEAGVMVDGAPATTVVLLDDSDPRGASRVELGAIHFVIIKRGDQYAVRLRDRNHPARRSFTGRIWYPIDPAYRVMASYTLHPQPRTLQIMSVAGVSTPIKNPGYVEFTLKGQRIHLEAFHEDGDLWFVFRDANPQIYRASRFLYAPVMPDGSAILDFNKAYNPPCAFTPYATCPLPLKENILSIGIEAGEKAPLEAQP